MHVTRSLAFFCAFQLLTIRSIVFHIWRRMVHSRPRLGSQQQQAEGWGGSEDFNTLPTVAETKREVPMYTPMPPFPSPRLENGACVH